MQTPHSKLLSLVQTGEVVHTGRCGATDLQCSHDICGQRRRQYAIKSRSPESVSIAHSEPMPLILPCDRLSICDTFSGCCNVTQPSRSLRLHSHFMEALKIQ